MPGSSRRLILHALGQVAAAKYFEGRFPDHAHSGIFGVPHLFINGEDLGYDLQYDAVLKRLCATGIVAGACNSEVGIAR